MYKKIILTILVVFLSISNLYSVTNEQYYNEYINKYISKEKLIIDSVYRYLYTTGDYNITRNKISNYFHYKAKIFTNLNNGKCKIVNNSEYCDNISGGINPILNTDNYTLTLKNHINNNIINSKLLSNYKNSPFLPGDFILSDNDLKIVLTPEIVKYITTIKNLEESNIYISQNMPTDSTINVWIKPTNNGILTLYIKNLDNKWINVYSLNKNNLNFNIYIDVDTNIDINLIKLPDNSKITFYDKNTKSFKSYLSKTGEWYPLITDTTFDLWSGDSKLFDLACVIFDKPSDSQADIGTTDQYITEPQLFTKYSDFGNGYWNSNKYYVINNYNTLSNLTFKTSINDIAYICSSDSLKYNTLLNIFNNEIWYYLTKDYTTITSNNNNDGKYVLSWNLLDSKEDQYKRLFNGKINSKNITTWKSEYLYNNGSPIKSSLILEVANNRDDFDNLNYDSYYLTNNSDCLTKQNCNGTDKFNHLGWKIDNMFVWLYNGTSLVDAYPIDSYNLMYNGINSGKKAYLLNTNHKVYIKDFDNNNHIIYKEKDNNTFWTANGQQVSTQYIYNNKPSFPQKVLNDKRTTNDIDISALNAIFINNNLIINDKIQMINWNSKINNNTKVVIPGNNGEYIWQDSYWKNDTTKEILTAYTRMELPNIDDNSYIYLTLYIGCSKDNLLDTTKECRYTDMGIRNSEENELYQWYPASTIKSVNNFVDVTKLNNINDLYNSDSEIAYVISNEQIYMKKLDINNNLCYRKLNSLDVLLKNGQTLPLRYLDINYNTNDIININIPINRTCSNLSVIGDALKFNDRTDLLNWTNIKENYVGRLLVNSFNYYVEKNYNNQYYFHSIDANEYLSSDNKNIFDDIATLDNKYITKNIGNRTLYNNGLKINDYLTTSIKINGIFSNDDKQLYVWYYNPLYNDYNMDKLTDIFINNDINKIYSMNINKIIFYSDNDYKLLNKDIVNNEKCYVNKPYINDMNSYEYILALSGKPSITKNNLPENKNCLNSEFNNNSLVVSNMITAINWNSANNGFSVIVNNNEKERYFHVKYDNKDYWINDTNLNDETILNSNEPNKIYAFNRTKIDTIPEYNLGLRAYTINIDNEPTNLELSNKQTYYQWENYKNLVPEIQNSVNEINNLSEYFTINTINNNLIYNDINYVIEYKDFMDKPYIEQPFTNTYKLHIDKNIENLNCNDIAIISSVTNGMNITSNKIWNEYISNYLKNNIVVINGKEYKVIYNFYVYDDNRNSIFNITLEDINNGNTYHYDNFIFNIHDIKFDSYDKNGNIIETHYAKDSNYNFYNNNISKLTSTLLPINNSSVNNCSVNNSFTLFDEQYVNEFLINNCQTGYLPYNLSKCYKDTFIIKSSTENNIAIYNINNEGYFISYDSSNKLLNKFDINLETKSDIIDLNNYSIGDILSNSLNNKKYILLYDNFMKKKIIKEIVN